MICKNCASEFESKFCPSCGQTANIHRISIGHLFHDAIHAVTHADKGFILLVKILLTKPGIVAHNYLKGERKKYFNPLSFFVITSAISAWVTTKAGYFEAMNASRSEVPARSAYWREVFEVSNHNIKLLSLILIAPLMSMATWLLFRKGKYNLAEHFTLHSFILGETHLLRVLIFVPIFLMFPLGVNQQLWGFQILSLIYMTIAYRQFFQQSWFVTVIKAILTMVLYIVLYWASIFGYVAIKHAIT